MRHCQAKMQEALSYSTWDVYGGGSLSDMMERNALSAAQSLASQVTMMVLQAQQTSGNVNPIGPMNVAHGHIISDVFFDNIFTDLAFHQKIEASAAELRRAHSKLLSEISAARQRTSVAGSELVHAADALAQSRRELDAFRRATFERVSLASSEHPSMPIPMEPPSYDSEISATTSESNTPHWGSRNPYAAAMAERGTKGES